MKAKFLVFFIGLSLLVSFNFVQAQITTTTPDLEALVQTLHQQIEDLRERILQLQEELKGITTELKEVEKTVKFTQNLYKGLKDKEVEDLQKFLSEYPEIYPEGLVTGYFGSLTERAVKKFQEKYASEILVPWGLTKGTGFVGEKTIAKINELMTEKKITICHYPPDDPDASHTIVIDESALEAHLAHGDTIGTCEPEPEPEPEPEDVCPNIDGVQETIPEGMIQNNEGNCVEPEPGAVLGCIDETAINYNSEATQDDGSCVYPDTTPPVISNFQPSGTITDLTPTLSLNTDENATCRYVSATDQSFDSMSSTFSGVGATYHHITLGTMTVGTYTYYARCQDTAGNKNTVSASITFTITTEVADTTAPVISNIQVSNITQTSATITWQTNEESNSVVDYGLTASYGSTASGETSVTYHEVNLSNLTNGTTYHYQVKSTDSAGNRALSSDRTFTTSLAPDTTPPVISNLQPSGTISDANPTLSVETDESATCKYDITETTYDSMANTFITTGGTTHSSNIGPLTDGIYTYFVRCKDTVGNKNTVSKSIIFTVSTSCHVVPLWDWAYCTDTCKCDVGEGDCDNDNQCNTGYCAKDIGVKYGQTATMDVCEVKAVNQAPVLNPIGDKTVDENTLLQLTISATDPDGDTLAYSASNLPAGATFTVATRTFSWIPTYDQSGTYSNVHFEVTDESLTDSEDITITVNDVPQDTTPPVISNFQPSGTITDLTPTLSLNTDENATCRYVGTTDQSFDAMSSTFSGVGTTYHHITLGTMTAGTYTYYARCQDTAGNKNTVSASITFTITITPTPDTTPPVISNIQVSNITQTSATITWQTDEESNSVVSYGLTTSYGSATSGEANATYHEVNLTNLIDGTTYHYRVKSTDSAGNRAISSDRTFTTLTPEPEDVCPNIVGVQVTFPDGMFLDSAGNCVGSECTDSDGGKNYYVKGITDTTQPFYSPKTDYCATSVGKNVLTEYFCAVDEDGFWKVESEQVVCPDGNVCLTMSGVCVNVTCDDSDGGYDVYTKGTITGPHTSDSARQYTSTEYCINDVWLHEYYCGADHLVTGDSYVCSNGCQDGACLSADTTPPANVTNLRAIAKNEQVDLYWTNPFDADFAGTKILRKTGGYPGSVTDGTQIYNGTGISYIDTGLTNGTRYYYKAFTYDEVPNYSLGVPTGATPFIPQDTFPPIVSNVRAFDITETSAIITWNTSEESDSIVNYGLNTSYGSTVSGETALIYHSVNLTNLTKGTTYHYKVSSTDNAGNQTQSSDKTFTTLAEIIPQFITRWGSKGSGDGQFKYPGDIAIDASGNVYVADSGNDRIQKFTSDGAFIAKWGSEGSGDGQFNSPARIAVDASDNVYVADYGNHRIQKFTSNGVFITKWGSEGSGDGQFYRLGGIAVDASGNVYVTSVNVVKTPIPDTIGSYKVEYENMRVQKFTSDGVFITKWGSEKWDSQYSGWQFMQPMGIAVDSSSNVYVADYRGSRIQKFTSDGAFITNWGSHGSGDGQFSYPWGIAVDANDDVYVVARYNHRVQKFTSDGSFITKWGSYGSSNGQFKSPRAIAIDASGNVYVADTNNHRIQKFGPVQLSLIDRLLKAIQFQVAAISAAILELLK